VNRARAVCADGPHHENFEWLLFTHDVRLEFETNVFGAHRVIRAALPFLRQHRHGHIIGVSSVAGIVAGPIAGFYHASKWAFEALRESLAREVLFSVC
jgi:NAD(P)-dependent dehydrogenase (short-subunit alcohol dehydrogenase family)